MIAKLIHKIAGFERQDRSEYYPRPSVAGPQRCIRQLAFHAAGIPESDATGNRFILTMDDSSWHEELTKDWLRKSAYRVHSEQMPCNVNMEELLPGLPVLVPERRCDVCGAAVPANVLHGHLDFLLADPLMEEFLCEHKALNHFSFERLCYGDEPPLDYFTQTAIYSRSVARDIGKEEIRGILLIKNKNTAQYLEFQTRYDVKLDTLYVTHREMSMEDEGQDLDWAFSGIVTGAVTRFLGVKTALDGYNEALAGGTPASDAVREAFPDRPYDFGTQFPCGYCAWETVCWATYTSEFDALSDDGNLEGDEPYQLVKYYAEVGAQIAEMEKERDALKKQVKALLKDAGLRGGRAGEYVISLSMQKAVRAIPVSEMPPDVRPLVTTTSTFETLRVTNPSKKKGAKGGGNAK